MRGASLVVDRDSVVSGRSCRVGLVGRTFALEWLGGGATGDGHPSPLCGDPAGTFTPTHRVDDGMIAVEVLFWVFARRLCGRMPPIRSRSACSLVAPRPRSAEDEATRDSDRGRVQRGERDRAAGREPARARLPAGPGPDRRDLRCVDRRTEEIALVSSVCTCDPIRGAERSRPRTARVRETRHEVVAFTDANSTWAARLASARARPCLRRSRGRICLRPAQTRPGRRRAATRKASRPARPARRSAAGQSRIDLGHRRQRIDLRGTKGRLRRGRPALRSRSRRFPT